MSSRIAVPYPSSVGGLLVANVSPHFCSFADFHPLLPDELKHLTEADWLARSRDGRFPPYFRFVNQKGPAYFRKSDIAAWWHLKLGALRPDLVQMMIDRGFEEFA